MAAAKPTPDYIIVGGGLCGIVIASRLKEGDPSLKIVIIEAGPDSRSLASITNAFGAFTSRQPQIDWKYQTTPQAHLDNRQYIVSGGKVLSGGTALNAALWTRGNRVDYDHWARVVGDQRWSYDGMLPYFKRIERHWNPEADPKQHGLNGPMHISSVSASDPDRNYPLRRPIRQALEAIDLKFLSDGNSGSPNGFFETTENWRDGQRQCSREVYNLDGVELLVNKTAHRVLVDERNDCKRAIGVELLDGEQIFAGREVILSAGSIGTPKLLMLSGIGSAEELGQFGIPVILNSPEVGQNYHDHLAVRMWWKLRLPSAGLAVGHPKWTNPAYDKGVPCDWLAISQTPAEQLQSALAKDGSLDANQHLLDDQAGHLEYMFVYAPIGAIPLGVNIPIDGSHISSLVIGMLPTSRGTVKLACADPLVPPLIDPNDYDTEADKVSIRTGIRQTLKMMLGTAEGRNFIEDSTPPAGVNKLTLESSDEDIDALVRKVGSTTFHPAGTAAMGSVVDAELKVVGVEGLRIVDASVLPVPIAAHLQVALYALSEQAADIVLGK